MSFLTSVLLGLLRFLCWALLLLWALYLVGAFYFDMKLGLPAGTTSIVFCVALVVLTAVLRGRRRIAALAATCALVSAVWLAIEPSHDRDWIEAKAVLPHAEFDGNRVKLFDVRDFEFVGYRAFEPHYVDRTIDLSGVTGLDMYVNWWGAGDLIAHPMLSWRFEGDAPLTISIENRESKDDAYSVIAGLYKQFELIYIVSSDRDAVMKRSHYDRDNDVYLYKLSTSAEESRALLVDYLHRVNSIYESPAWYNTLFSNCTTNIRVHEVASADFPLPWDWGILLPGLYARGIHRHGGMASDLPFEEIERLGHLNPAAIQIGYADDFWALIRQGVPGFERLRPPPLPR